MKERAMQKTSRRSFLKLAGAGTAIAASAAVPGVATVFDDRTGRVAIRAIGGVPAGPLPTYATYALDGYVDPAGQTGTLTRTVFAGNPEAVSRIALPGLSRTVLVTGVSHEDRTLHVTGTVADRSQLLPGESADIDIWIDRTAGVVRMRSGASEMELTLQT
jgi:hypothetical protein